MEDPMPNELDNALSQLIPAVKACSNPNNPKLFRDLNTFEQMAGTAPSWRALARASTGAGASGALSNGGAGGSSGGGASSSGGSGSRALLDERVAGEVEVAFRHCMHEAAMEMVEQTCVEGSGKARGAKGKGLESSAAVGLLTLALEFATAEAARSSSLNKAIAALPMVLLEDLLESQGTEKCKEIWAVWVEPNTAALTAPALLVVGVYTLIRLCNKLAARMSKTYDSSFCGQIHLFLSKAVSFFDRSGLNVTGAVNATNKTEFEDEKAFQRAMVGFDGEEEAGPVVAGNGDGAVGGAGTRASRGVDAMAVDTDGGGEPEAGKNEFAVDYGLYQSFWRLQKYAMAQDVVIRGKDPELTMKNLLHDVDKILGAFDASAFSEQDLRLAKQRWDSGSAASVLSSGHDGATPVPSGGKRKRPHSGGDGGGGGREADAMDVDAASASGNGAAGMEDGKNGRGYFGLKYLTSPRLLRLQLRDPTLRLQVLTQWLIIAASLKSKMGKDKESASAVADLNQRMERAKKLAKATPPRGEEYLRMLQTVLHREIAWTRWKDVNKCKAVESVAAAEAKAAAAAEAKAAAAAASGQSSKNSEASVPPKRSRLSSAVAAAERAKHAPLDRDFALDNIVAQLRQRVPSAEEHLEDQRLSAEDPDTPASELPSANTLYAWRARRKLGVENPANLDGCFDGDIVKAMARMDEAEKAAQKAKEKAAAEAEAAAKAKANVKAEAETEGSSGTAGVTPMAVDGGDASKGSSGGGDPGPSEGNREGVAKSRAETNANPGEGRAASSADSGESAAASTKGSQPPAPASNSTQAAPKAKREESGVSASTSTGASGSKRSDGGVAKAGSTGATPSKASGAAPSTPQSTPKPVAGGVRGGENGGRVNGEPAAPSATITPSPKVSTRRSSRTASRGNEAVAGATGGDEEGQV